MLSESCVNLPADDIVNSELNVGRGKAVCEKNLKLKQQQPSFAKHSGSVLFP